MDGVWDGVTSLLETGAGYGWWFVVALTRYPLPTAAFAFLLLPLLNFGRTFGLPLLFWHERRWDQLKAGAASSMVVVSLAFVIFLLESSRSGARSADAAADALIRACSGALISWWLCVVLAGTLRSIRRRRRQHGDTIGTATADAPGLVPGVRDPGTGGEARLRSVHIAPWPFVVGTVVVGVIGLTLITISRWLFRSPQPPALLLHLLFVPSRADAVTGWVHVLAAVFVAALAIAYVFIRRNATPAVAICMLLAAIAAVDGFVTFRAGHPAATLALATAALLLSALRPYRLRLSALQAYYEHPVSYPPRLDQPPARARLLSLISPRPNGCGPLVIVCASGGGVRAAAWTAAVLERLDGVPQLRGCVHLICGASGGMVGAAFWLARLYAEERGEPRTQAAAPLVHCVAGDSLTPVARRLAFFDLPLAFLPLRNDYSRGQALEDAWRAQAPEWLDLTFGDLREHEESGRYPSLVFTPMLIEDGRRLLISNRDLSLLTTNEVGSLHTSSRREIASVSGYHLEELFPGRLATFPVRTAARLSAAFPYVSPAVVLPTKPPRRVVDAGYYDNYGVGLACGWLRECLDRYRPWLERNVSRILVIQIRDDDIPMNAARSSAPASVARAARRGVWKTLASGFHGLTSPVEGLLRARESAMLFRNDADLETVTQLFGTAFGPEFLTTTVFELTGEVSLSWYLTAAEMEIIERGVHSPAVESKLRDVQAWLGSER